MYFFWQKLRKHLKIHQIKKTGIYLTRNIYTVTAPIFQICHIRPLHYQTNVILTSGIFWRVNITFYLCGLPMILANEKTEIFYIIIIFLIPIKHLLQININLIY